MGRFTKCEFTDEISELFSDNDHVNGQNFAMEDISHKKMCHWVWLKLPPSYLRVRVDDVKGITHLLGLIYASDFVVIFRIAFLTLC